jgi:glycosyltransferase involved in cell wall biosynthesis
VHTLLAAIDGVPNVSVDLVGDAPDARYAARVRALAWRLGGRVREHGSLGRAALSRRYAAASIFALPSVREGYGIAYAEALAHGLPIVACDIPAVREVTDGAAVLVAPGRVRPLTVALRRLVADERARSALGRRARARARSLPTWRRSEAALVGVVRAELRAAA